GDTFIYNAGYGQLEINENGNGLNVLQLGNGITADDVQVSEDSSGNVYLTDGTSGDRIQLSSETGGTGSGVDQVQFADGTTWSQSQLIAIATARNSGVETLYGTSGPDTLDSEDSNAYEQGNGGGDRFIYNVNYGQLEINESGRGVNVLQIGQGISPASITLATDSAGDVILNIGSTITGGTVSSFVGGQTNSNYAGGPLISGSGATITMTDGGGDEAGSWFTNQKYAVGAFTASFDYQAQGTADGMAFILQDSASGPSALGGVGGSLGYSGISNSAAIELNLYSGHTQGTAFASDGNTGNYTSTGDVAFWNGDEVQVQLSYDGSTMAERMTDFTTGAVYSASYAINLASILGSGSAYVGFSGGTGGATSTQTVSNFTFQGGVSNVIRLDNEMDGDGQGVEQVQFADGTVWTQAQIAAMTGSKSFPANLVQGSTGDDNLNGTSGSDIFDGQGGSDYERGNGGGDIFLYNAGYGQLEINEN
ncbi:calcium-binding protein, partial [Lichenicoccus roseus]